MNEDTKSLQNKIKVLLEENEILKSDIEELDEEVATQRKRGKFKKNKGSLFPNQIIWVTLTKELLICVHAGTGLRDHYWGVGL